MRTHNDYCLKTESIMCTCDRESYIEDLESKLKAIENLEAENAKLKEDIEKSHKSYDSVEESFLKTSTLLTEACIKNKSLWEQFNLWKTENEKMKERERGLVAEIERLKACPICHRPFVGKQWHSNCGDNQLGSAGQEAFEQGESK